MSAINVKFAFVKYCTGEKEIISVDRIKGFNAKNINFEKKYKILWNEAYYDGVIILVAGNYKLFYLIKYVKYMQCNVILLLYSSILY